MVFLFACCGGCAKKETPQNTSRIYDDASVRAIVQSGVYCGDVAYAEVNSQWLHDYYPTFQSEIFRQGVTKWDDRFDCNHFASYYVSLAQTKFYLTHFQSWTTAQSLGVGTFWYVTPKGAHAIVFALTERGLIFLEPQTGQEVALTQAQKDSCFLASL